MGTEFAIATTVSAVLGAGVALTYPSKNGSKNTSKEAPFLDQCRSLLPILIISAGTLIPIFFEHYEYVLIGSCAFAGYFGGGMLATFLTNKFEELSESKSKTNSGK